MLEIIYTGFGGNVLHFQRSKIKIFCYITGNTHLYHIIVTYWKVGVVGTKRKWIHESTKIHNVHDFLILKVTQHVRKYVWQEKTIQFENKVTTLQNVKIDIVIYVKRLLNHHIKLPITE